MSTKIAKQALQLAISKAGGERKLSKQLHIHPTAVGQWDLCPPLRVIQVERLTGVSRHDLRPDLYPRDAA